jgi:hypothetical protein
MSEIDRIKLPDVAAEPRSYRDALMAVADDRDPLEIIEETPRRIREIIAGRDLETLQRRPEPDEWSAVEIIGHLIDDEIVNGFRLRLTLTSDQPTYPGNEPDRWAVLPKPPFDQLLQIWEGLRAYNLVLMRSIARPDWARIGLHAEQGPESIEVMFRKNAGHDLAHLNQLERAVRRSR